MSSDPKELKAGDLAMLVRADNKCGCALRIGKVFEVLDVLRSAAPCICNNCEKTMGTFTGFAKTRHEGGKWYSITGQWLPFAWLIKIDPPAKGSEEERFQPILTDKEKNDAEISAMKKGLKREFDKLSDQIKEITK